MIVILSRSNTGSSVSSAWEHIDIVELAGKVQVVPSQQKDGRTEVRVKMVNGKEYASTFTHPGRRGTPAYPLSKKELYEKFWNNINFIETVPERNAEKALDMLENLEQVDDVSKIIKLLIA